MLGNGVCVAAPVSFTHQSQSANTSRLPVPPGGQLVALTPDDDVIRDTVLVVLRVLGLL